MGLRSIGKGSGDWELQYLKQGITLLFIIGIKSIIYIKTKHFGATWHYFNPLIATWHLLKPLLFFLSGNLFTRGFSNTHY
ncbi:hypothetical protein HanIR_Chr02g0060111 [Helianthus annuus]|nr:hypothetical protein HanIR_Chr02g0060111 [Helianthus annuus]